MSEPPSLDRRCKLHGRDLRHAAIVVLDRCGPARIGEIAEVFAAHGFDVDDVGTPARKRLADALRHEVRRGRLQRVGWGRYAVRALARTTRWRLHRRWDTATAARLDERGDRVHATPNPRARISSFPWTKHDRHGDQVWLQAGRHRWLVGQWASRVLLDRQRRSRHRRCLDDPPPQPGHHCHWLASTPPFEERIPLAAVYGPDPPRWAAATAGR